jgi:signal peptidase I
MRFWRGRGEEPVPGPTVSAPTVLAGPPPATVTADPPPATGTADPAPAPSPDELVPVGAPVVLPAAAAPVTIPIAPATLDLRQSHQLRPGAGPPVPAGVDAGRAPTALLTAAPVAPPAPPPDPASLVVATPSTPSTPSKSATAGHGAPPAIVPPEAVPALVPAPGAPRHAAPAARAAPPATVPPEAVPALVPAPGAPRHAAPAARFAPARSDPGVPVPAAAPRHAATAPTAAASQPRHGTAPPVEPRGSRHATPPVAAVVTGGRGTRYAPQARSRALSPSRLPTESLPFWVELPALLVVAFLVAFLVKTFLFQPFFIPSGSMEDTLHVGDRVLVNKVVYHLRPIERGDVVVFDGADSFTPEVQVQPPTNPAVAALSWVGAQVGFAPPDSNDFIKRVVGVGGDHVKCCDARGRVTVNGVPLDEQSYLFPGDSPSIQPFDVTVPEGKLWVMGDHRSGSSDSRAHLGDPGGGFVPVDEVIGRAVAVIWPISDWQLLQIPATFEQPALDPAVAR